MKLTQYRSEQVTNTLIAITNDPSLVNHPRIERVIHKLHRRLDVYHAAGLGPWHF